MRLQIYSSFFQSELRQFQAVEIGWHYDPVQTANRIGEGETRSLSHNFTLMFC